MLQTLVWPDAGVAADNIVLYTKWTVTIDLLLLWPGAWGRVGMQYAVPIGLMLIV